VLIPGVLRQASSLLPAAAAGVCAPAARCGALSREGVSAATARGVRAATAARAADAAAAVAEAIEETLAVCCHCCCGVGGGRDAARRCSAGGGDFPDIRRRFAGCGGYPNGVIAPQAEATAGVPQEAAAVAAATMRTGVHSIQEGCGAARGKGDARLASRSRGDSGGYRPGGAGCLKRRRRRTGPGAAAAAAPRPGRGAAAPAAAVEGACSSTPPRAAAERAAIGRLRAIVGAARPPAAGPRPPVFCGAGRAAA